MSKADRGREPITDLLGDGKWHAVADVYGALEHFDGDLVALLAAVVLMGPVPVTSEAAA